MTNSQQGNKIKIDPSHRPLPAQSPQMKKALDVWATVSGGLRSGS